MQDSSKELFIGRRNPSARIERINTSDDLTIMMCSEGVKKAKAHGQNANKKQLMKPYQELLLQRVVMSMSMMRETPEIFATRAHQSEL